MDRWQCSACIMALILCIILRNDGVILGISDCWKKHPTGFKHSFMNISTFSFIS